jgi:hypothetical protein
MVEDPLATFERTIFPLLGRAATDLRARHRKQAIRPLSELVSNFSEVRKLLTGTRSLQQYDLSGGRETGAAPASGSAHHSVETLR